MAWTNSTASSFNASDMLAKLKELSAKMQSVPNRFITTTATLAKIRLAIGTTIEDNDIGLSDRLLGSMNGLPVEDYPTVRECMDRMMKPNPGERLKLVLSEGIPVDCMSHPYMKQAVDEIASRYAIGHPK